MNNRTREDRRLFPPGLGKRVFSALLLVPLALLAVYAGGIGFAFLVGIATLAMNYEWSRMVDGDKFSIGFYCLSAATLVSMTLAVFGYYAPAFAIAAVGGFAAWILGRRKTEIGFWRGFGALYIIAPSIALIWLRTEPEYGRTLTFLLFFVVWATDSGAFAVGKWLGGPKLNPLVSPKKTWSGTMGGILAGSCVAALIAWAMFGASTTVIFFFIGCGLAVASVIGDFVESAMKRGFGVKDTGGLIPGHGGVLDRLDGMIFATLVMTIVLYLYLISGFAAG